jgi:hypothetical protein
VPCRSPRSAARSSSVRELGPSPVLVPALEIMCERTRAWGKPRVDVSAWTKPDEINTRLSVRGPRIYCHWVDQRAYELLRDLPGTTQDSDEEP